MHFGKFSFGALCIDGSTYEQDVVIDRGEIRKTQEGTFLGDFVTKFGHAPLSIEEKIPWKCHRLVIGTGAYGRLPVMKEVIGAHKSGPSQRWAGSFLRQGDCARSVAAARSAPEVS